MSEVVRRVSALDIDNGVLDPFIYADEAVYQLELERVFARSWLFLAHECQVPQPGDFFSSYMAEDPIVVLRQRDGSVAAFLNQCRHRGMRLCQSDFGHTQVVADKALDTMNGASQVIVGILVGATAVGFDVVQKAIRNVGQNDTPPVS